MIKEIDSLELESRLASHQRLYLVDIRSEAEVMRGMLPNSCHLPMHLIPARMDDLPEDRDVILYCHSGARSYHACMFLMQKGFQNVVNLKGGIIDWSRKGLNIESYA